MLRYKGYMGHVNFDAEAEIFHGEVIDTRDVITFQGKTVKELKKAFRDSIDDYLEFCKNRKEKPDKPFSGKFVLRLTPELHHKVYLMAIQSGKSLNSWIREVLRKSV